MARPLIPRRSTRPLKQQPQPAEVRSNFPTGVYMCFSIRLKSKVHLHLTQGATIIAADSPKLNETTGYMGGTYDLAEPNTAWDGYQDYGHNHWHNSLIWGEDISDVSITGPGLIWGKGLSYGIGPGRAPNSQGSGTHPMGAPENPKEVQDAAARAEAAAQSGSIRCTATQARARRLHGVPG